MRSVIFTLYKILFIPHLLLYRLSNNRDLIDKDIERWKLAKKKSGGNQSLLLHFLTYSKDFRTIFYFRTNSNMFSHILNIFFPKERRFIIDISTELGGGILTGHPYCTILNANSIGDNFYVNHLVTVGEIDGKRPTIGNNVSIYTGAIVIGEISIGDGAIIGAGAVVVKDVPPNSVAVGNPARIIPQKND